MSIDLDSLPLNIRRKLEQMSVDIVFSKEITKGGNGYVFIGKNSLLDRDVAIKFYYWGDGAHVEPRRLAELASNHILSIHDASSIDNDWAYFITPHCSNGDLDDCLNKFQYGPIEAIDLILQIAEGVSYLHSRGYVHRDLKPSNVFATCGGSFVIGDFGSVVVLGEDDYAATQSNHSLIYRPPEDFLASRFYRQGDIYQLGILLFQVLGGNLPYEERSWLSARQSREYDQLCGIDKQLFAQGIIQNKIRNGKILRFESLPAWVPTRLVKVIRKAYRTDRNQRHLTVADLVGELNNVRGQLHDWRIVEGCPTLQHGTREYRIVENGDLITVEKRVSAGWRNDNTIRSTTLRAAVLAIEAKVC